MSDSEWAFYLQIPNRCGQLGGDGVGQGQRNVLWVANLGNKWSISEYRLIAFAFAVLLKIQPPSSNIPQQPRISRPPIFGKQLIIRGNKNTAHFLSPPLSLGVSAQMFGVTNASPPGPRPGSRGRDQPNFPAERSVARTHFCWPGNKWTFHCSDKSASW